MQRMERLLDLPGRLSMPQKVGTALLLFVMATALRWAILPAHGGLIFVTYLPALIFAYFLCGRGIGIAFVLASASAANFLFTPADRWDAGQLVASYGLTLIAGVVIGEFFRLLDGNLRELRETRERYHGILEAQTEWVFRLRANGTVLYVNQAVEASFGIRATTTIGQSWHPIAHPDDVAGIERQLQKLSPAHPVVVIENRVYNARNEVIWGSFVNRGFFDADGQLVEIQSVGRDITERKQLEQRLHSLTAELSDLYMNAPCAYYSLDAEGVIIKANARLLQWLGATADELIGKARIADFYDNVGKSLFAFSYPHFRQTGRLDSLEFDLVSRDGTVRRVSVSANAQYDEHGAFAFSRSVMTDITERKRAERELQRFNDTLEQRVKERTAELVRLQADLETFSRDAAAALSGPLGALDDLALALEADATLSSGGTQRIAQLRTRVRRLRRLAEALSLLTEPPALPQDLPACAQQEVVADVLRELDPAAPRVILHPLPDVAVPEVFVREVWSELLEDALSRLSRDTAGEIEIGPRANGAVPAFFVEVRGIGDGAPAGAGAGQMIAERILDRLGGSLARGPGGGDGRRVVFSFGPDSRITPR